MTPDYGTDETLIDGDIWDDPNEEDSEDDDFDDEDDDEDDEEEDDLELL